MEKANNIFQEQIFAIRHVVEKTGSKILIDF